MWRLRKKWIRRISSFFFVLLFGFVASVPGFCAGSKNYIRYDSYTIDSCLLNASGNPHTDYSGFPLSSVDQWSNYYWSVDAWPYSEAFILRVRFRDFFRGLVVDSTYHYHLTFGFTGGSSVASKFGSTASAFIGSSSFSASKTSVANGDTRYIFDFDVSGLSGNLDLILSFPVSSCTFGSVTFLAASWGEASWFTVLSGVDKVTSYLDQPVSPPPGQSGTDNTISSYLQGEDQLNSYIGDPGSTLLADINKLDLSGYLSGFNLVNTLFSDLYGRLGKLQTIISFALVSGVIMVILGLGARLASRSLRVRSRSSSGRKARGKGDG